MTNAIIVVSIILGGPGYLIATIMILGLRVWFGQRATPAPRAKWIRIVLNSLLLLLAALAAVYGIVFFNALVPPSDLRLLYTRAVLAVGLSAIPYFIALPLGGWWLGIWRTAAPHDLPIALTPQIIPLDPAKEE